MLKDNLQKAAKWTCIYYYIFTAKSSAGKETCIANTLHSLIIGRTLIQVNAVTFVWAEWKGNTVPSGKDCFLGCLEISVLYYAASPRAQKQRAPKWKPSLWEKVFLGKLGHYLKIDSNTSYPYVCKDGFFQTIRTWELLADEAVRGQFCRRTISQLLTLSTLA